jgi:hypothetical protein
MVNQIVESGVEIHSMLTAEDVRSLEPRNLDRRSLPLMKPAINPMIPASFAHIPSHKPSMICTSSVKT